MQVIRSGVITAIALIFFMPSMNARRVTKHNEWPQWTEQHQLNGLDVTMRGLSKAETKKLFDTRGKRLLRRRKSIRPIEIAIKNEADKDIKVKVSDILKAFNFSTPLRDVSHIVEAPQKNSRKGLAIGLFCLAGLGIDVFIGYLACLSLIGCGLKPAVLLGLSVNDVWIPWTVYIGVPLSVLSVAVPAADYLYSIIEGYRQVTQSIIIKPGQMVRVHVFVNANVLC